MKADPLEIHQFISGAHACAMQMMGNAAYIQKELPSLRMPESLRAHISTVCDELIGTKHDLISEAVELGEELASDPSAPRILNRIKAMHGWIQEAVASLDECVKAVNEAVSAGAAPFSVAMLIMESATNILNSTPASPDIADPAAEVEIEDNEGNDDCYAFQIEDSYPMGELTRSVRSLMERENLPAEVRDNLKVFLIAMLRLPMMTPGIRMSLALRIDQGGESDWIEIRMEDGEFTLGRGSWVDGGADTETVFEVSEGYRDGDEFAALGFAASFKECAADPCREVVIEDSSDEPFTGWDLKPDKSRWASL